MTPRLDPSTRPVPAEWSPHGAMWLGFPSHAELWEQELAPAQAEVISLALALAGPGRERVRLMASGAAAAEQALARLDGQADVELVLGEFGDIWLRDTGPIFRATGDAGLVAEAFGFNGWGGKYELEGDGEVAEQLAAAAGAPLSRHDVVLEGGALDHDGFGAALSTEQCLLNPNRNPAWTAAVAEAVLGEALGVRKVLWLGEGLRNDHTDGHIDNLARFVAPGVVACPVAAGRDDPNADVYEAAARRLSTMKDARGAQVQVARIPSPGRITDKAGAVVPASHMNFIIANGAVVMPVYEPRWSEMALDALRALFPEREVIGLPSRALLTGGGSFHCISQQEPAPVV